MQRIFLLCIVAILLCGSALAQQQTHSDLQPVFGKWLDADVIYIITPQEKRAFLSLKTDEERNQFVEAFWRRRDPNLDTDQNEFRDEHYARIAHANHNFAFGQVPGWRTDRGRIFILHGQPDQVQKTSAGEVWTYRYIQGIGAIVSFQFVETKGTGDYHLLAQS